MVMADPIMEATTRAWSVHCSVTHLPFQLVEYFIDYM